MYDSDSIKSFEWHEHIRLRPGMYIGALNSHTFANTIAGIAEILIRLAKNDAIDFRIKIMTDRQFEINVYCNASAFPAEILNLKGFASHRCLEWNVAAALSTSFMIINPDQPELRSVTENGRPVQFDFVPANPAGKLDVRMQFDDSFFGKAEPDFDCYSRYFQTLAWLNPNATIIVEDHRKPEFQKRVFNYPGGLADWLRYLEEETDSYWWSKEQIMALEITEGDLTLRFAWLLPQYERTAIIHRTYVYDRLITNNGSLTNGFFSGIRKALITFKEKYRKRLRFDLRKKLLFDRIRVIAAVKGESEFISFAGPTRSMLDSKEIAQLAERAVYEHVLGLLETDETLVRKFFS